MNTGQYDFEGTRQKMLNECQVGSMSLADILTDKAQYQHGQHLVCEVRALADGTLLAVIAMETSDGKRRNFEIRRSDQFFLASRGYSAFEETAVRSAKDFMLRIIQRGIYYDMKIEEQREQLAV